MPNRLVIASLLCCGWVPGVGFAQQGDTLVLTLARAEQFALENNALVHEARANLELAQAKQRQAAHSRFLPEFKLKNFWGPVPRARGRLTESGAVVSPDTSFGLEDIRFFTEVDLEILQPIYTFGKLRGLIDAAESGVEASRADVGRRELEVRLLVRKLYWGLVLGQELIRVAEDVQDQVAEAEAKLEERFDDGSITQNDIFKFEIFSFDISRRYREVVDRSELGKAALRAAIGLQDGAPFRLEDERLELLDVTLDRLSTYLATARENRPEIRQLDAGIDARSSIVRATRSDLWPQIYTGVQVAWNWAPSRFDPNNPFVYNPTNFFRPSLLVGFEWNLNIFRTQDKVRVAEYEAAILRQRVKPLSEKIEQDVRKAYLGAKRAAADAEESRRALRASENWLRAELQTFDLGLSEINDLIDAFRANASMRTEHLRTIFEFNSAMAELSRAAGRDLYPRAVGGGMDR